MNLSHQTIHLILGLIQVLFDVIKVVTIAFNIHYRIIFCVCPLLYLCSIAC